MSNEVAAHSEQSTWGQIGALTRWSLTDDRTAATQPARSNSPSELEWHARKIDPDNRLSPEERARRARAAQRAYFLRLALKSAQARRKRGAA